ncbi:DUF58 domain-containing protein [Pleionea mediterranea]|uniref:Uncharacterized protein (DUF58 family) n=1 Tax=Pleionea mediterranea TaxID=523701 RepID=A0A316FYB6_9GAMM|nr:DUF58 domain-containing protein [Pleionea mediterranea]PWK53382.1 uncharacterized protein (DUF58 family) [Pleionea mediterranea]
MPARWLSSLRLGIRAKLERWQRSRAPLAKSLQLSQRNTYVFPTRYGFMLLLTIILMGIGATNYQNNLVFIATFTVIAIGIVAILLTFNNLVGLKFSVHNAEPVFCGQTVRVPISVTADKEHLSISIGAEQEVLHTIDVAPMAEQRVDVVVPALKRGVHSLKAVRCQTLFPLGFVQAWSWLFFDSQYVVYPKPVAPDTEWLGNGDSNGQYSDSFKPGVEEFYGLRSYKRGDLMSRIHWKSFAQGKGLQTKEFVDYLTEPDVFDYDAFVGIDVETRLSQLCYLLLNAHEEGNAFGIKLPNKYLAPDKGESHLHNCLLALAEFEG